jgi:hypothetical protein
MSISPEDACIGQRSEATVQAHDRFIDHQRPLLLRYIDGKAPGSVEDPDALGYVEGVLKAWQEAFGQAELTNPSPEERTFWFALYLLEELVELSGPHVDPYEKILMENLNEVGELLRHCRPLPEHRFMATRPDGS